MSGLPRLVAAHVPQGTFRFPSGVWLADCPDLEQQILDVLRGLPGAQALDSVVELETAQGRYRVGHQQATGKLRVVTLQGQRAPDPEQQAPLESLLGLPPETTRASWLADVAPTSLDPKQQGQMLATLSAGLTELRRHELANLKKESALARVLAALARELESPLALEDQEQAVQALERQAERLDACSGGAALKAAAPDGWGFSPLLAAWGLGGLACCFTGVLLGTPTLALLGALVAAGGPATLLWRARQARQKTKARREDSARMQQESLRLLQRARVLPPDGPLTGSILRAGARRVAERDRARKLRQALRALLPSAEERDGRERSMKLLQSEAVVSQGAAPRPTELILQLTGLVDGLQQAASAVRPEQHQEASSGLQAQLLRQQASGTGWPLFLEAEAVSREPDVLADWLASESHKGQRFPLVICLASSAERVAFLAQLPAELSRQLQPLPRGRLRRRSRQAAVSGSSR